MATFGWVGLGSLPHARVLSGFVRMGTHTEELLAALRASPPVSAETRA